MSDLHVVILAAGKGTRMKSDVPKILHRISGRAIIDRVLDTADSLEPSTTTLVEYPPRVCPPSCLSSPL